MKRLLLTTSIAALLLSSVTAFAGPGKDKGHDDRRSHVQGNYRDDDRGDRRGDDRYDRRGDDRYDHRDDDRRYGADRRGNNDYRHDGRHDNGRHLGHYKHAYRRGQRAPAVYLQPRYYVQDYRTYRLSAPPRGYRWVRPDNDRYLLVEVATGLISQVLGY